MKRPAMPGPNTSVWLCVMLAGGRVEFDMMMGDDESVAARPGDRSCGLEARGDEPKLATKVYRKECDDNVQRKDQL
jgi:hypothetical protein